MTLRTKIIAGALPLILAGCHLPKERDQELGRVCKNGHCYKVVEKTKYRTTSILEGESSEKVLAKKVIVTDVDRATGQSREFPTLVCLDVSCTDHAVILLVCGNRILPKDHPEAFSIQGESAAKFTCGHPIDLGRFPPRPPWLNSRGEYVGDLPTQ